MGGASRAAHHGFIDDQELLGILLDHVLAGGDLLTSPVAPVVQSIGFGNQTVAEHQLVRAAVRLEDAAAQEDMGQAEHGDEQKPRSCRNSTTP